MSTIKTAISIDKALFAKVETMAKKYHLAKSQIFSQAVEYMIEKNEGIDLINRINASLLCDVKAEYEVSAKTKKLYAKTIKDKW